jgi:hypothetical protein
MSSSLKKMSFRASSSSLLCIAIAIGIGIPSPTYAFDSAAIDAGVKDMLQLIKDPHLQLLFNNTFRVTLETTVQYTPAVDPGTDGVRVNNYCSLDEFDYSSVKVFIGGLP